MGRKTGPQNLKSQEPRYPSDLSRPSRASAPFALRRTFCRLLPILAAGFIFVSPFTIRAQEIPSAGTESFSIPDRGGWSATSGGTAETVRVGYGRIRADAGSTTPSGLAIFQFRDSQGVLISEAGVPATEPVLEGRIFAEVDGPVNTGLAIANPNDETATIDFYFTDTDGTSFSYGTVQLDAHQRLYIRKHRTLPRSAHLRPASCRHLGVHPRFRTVGECPCNHDRPRW